MIIAGVGARSNATADEIVVAVTECCRRNGLDPSEVGVLAALDRPGTVAAVRAAAARFYPDHGGGNPDSYPEVGGLHPVLAGLKPVFFGAFELQKQASRCITNSERSLAATGVPSVAEAAALAAAGPEGMLLAPRVCFATVTVAIAIGPGATMP